MIASSTGWLKGKGETFKLMNGWMSCRWRPKKEEGEERDETRGGNRGKTDTREKMSKLIDSNCNKQGSCLTPLPPNPPPTLGLAYPECGVLSNIQVVMQCVLQRYGGTGYRRWDTVHCTSNAGTVTLVNDKGGGLALSCPWVQMFLLTFSPPAVMWCGVHQQILGKKTKKKGTWESIGKVHVR